MDGQSQSIILDAFRSMLGDPVIDPEEEAFLAFSQALPSQSLGFIVSKEPTIDISVAGRDLTIHQSRGLLTSDRQKGTTGAVVWEVTPLFAEWIAAPNFLHKSGYLTPDSIALELGAGVSGIVALTVGSRIKKYIATDQDYVIRLLKQNISENLPTASTNAGRRTKTRNKTSQVSSTQPAPSIETFDLDWETDTISSLPSLFGQGERGVDVIIACDCIYNDALIEPFNNICGQISRLRSEDTQLKPTVCIIAQQLRSPDVFESWVKSFHQIFHVWRVPDSHLAASLKENSGFVVHVGILRA